MRRIFKKKFCCLQWEVFIEQSGSQVGGKCFAVDEEVENELRSG
jgi:hypothetical protein